MDNDVHYETEEYWRKEGLRAKSLVNFWTHCLKDAFEKPE